VSSQVFHGRRPRAAPDLDSGLGVKAESLMLGQTSEFSNKILFVRIKKKLHRDSFLPPHFEGLKNNSRRILQ
jgi:hypothetical protein